MDYSAAPHLYPRAPDGAPSICGKPSVVGVKDHSEGLVKKILGARVEAGRPIKTIADPGHVCWCLDFPLAEKGEAYGQMSDPFWRHNRTLTGHWRGRKGSIRDNL